MHAVGLFWFLWVIYLCFKEKDVLARTVLALGKQEDALRESAYTDTLHAEEDTYLTPEEKETEERRRKKEQERILAWEASKNNDTQNEACYTRETPA